MECFRRNNQDIWELYTYQKTDQVYFNSVDFTCDFSLIYEDIELDIQDDDQAI